MNRTRPIIDAIHMANGMAIVPRMIRAHLHADTAALPASLVTALDIAVPTPDVVVYGEHMYRLHEGATSRHRRPTYVRASYIITGPVARRAGLKPAAQL